MSDVLIDTDVAIDHLRGFRALSAAAGARLHCSVVTRAELFAGPAEQEEAAAVLLSGLTEIEVDADIARAAGLIRRATGIAIADALIAATAVANGLELLTRNARHFERVDGLRLATV